MVYMKQTWPYDVLWLTFTCSKSTTEKLEKGVKYVNNKNTRMTSLTSEDLLCQYEFRHSYYGFISSFANKMLSLADFL